jgi:hypothetical protein
LFFPCFTIAIHDFLDLYLDWDWNWDWIQLGLELDDQWVASSGEGMHGPSDCEVAGMGIDFCSVRLGTMSENAKIHPV